MAIVRPFKALRPTKKYIKEVAALPYDVYSREEAKQYVEDKPYSFLNIDRPETQFDSDYNMYDETVYQKADQMIQDFEKKGIFEQDKQNCFYIYELTMGIQVQTGIVGLSSIDDYLNDICKKHEFTVEEKEIDRINHVDYTSAQTGPIFLTYRAKQTIKDIVNDVKKEAPLYDFIADDGVKHTVWKIEDEALVKNIEEYFKTVPYTYIADGHHRTASAVKVGLKRRQEHPNYTGEEEFNYFLSVLFPSDELKILDYNRVVFDLNGNTKEEYLNKLSEKYTVTKTEKGHPGHKGELTMYLDQEWYLLTPHNDMLESRKESPVKILDVATLQEEVLTPILGIGDPRVDKRIKFVGGIRGLDELEKEVNQRKEAVAFAMYPTSIDELLNVADASLIMPPKSTWFEPKLRSGIFIHKFER